MSSSLKNLIENIASQQYHSKYSKISSGIHPNQVNALVAKTEKPSNFVGNRRLISASKKEFVNCLKFSLSEYSLPEHLVRSFNLIEQKFEQIQPRSAGKYTSQQAFEALRVFLSENSTALGIIPFISDPSPASRPRSPYRGRAQKKESGFVNDNINSPVELGSENASQEINNEDINLPIELGSKNASEEINLDYI